MKYHKLVISAAKQTPIMGRILKEKSELYRTTQVQGKRIDGLERENSRLKKQIAKRSYNDADVIWPPLEAEIIKASHNKPTGTSTKTKKRPPFTINWVVPRIVTSSGGQSDIFRTIKFLRDNGHTCRIYIFDPSRKSNLEKQTTLIKDGFPGQELQVHYNTKTIADCDIIFATHWLTAYPVYNFRGEGRKYYYVQGYEPHTQPAGYLNYLSESTYSFGFRGIALGEWLCEKLTKDYKMQSEYFDFGYDPKEYFIINSNQARKDVLYYAQPQKAHRGFELGVMALEKFHIKNPDSKIHLFGSDLSQHKLPFPFIDHGVLKVHQLNDLYNHCAAGLALSFTNISLIPLEMLASGCIPVINDAYQTRKIKYAGMVSYAQPDPMAIAEALSAAVRSNRYGLKAELSEKYTWDHSNRQIENILIKDLA